MTGRISARMRRNGPEGAFTLAEVCISLGTIGVVVLALYAAIAVSSNLVQVAREDERATQIMIEMSEALRTYTWDQIMNPSFSPKTNSVYFDPAGATNGTGRGVLYQCRLSIAPGPTDVAYNNDMATLGIQITWNNGSKVRTRNFSTFITRNGMQSYIY